MPQIQAEPTATTKPRRSRRRVPEFIAAVRFADGRRQLFAVSNALDCNEARRMVLEEVEEVASVLICLR